MASLPNKKRKIEKEEVKEKEAREAREVKKNFFTRVKVKQEELIGRILTKDEEQAIIDKIALYYDLPYISGGIVKFCIKLDADTLFELICNEYDVCGFEVRKYEVQLEQEIEAVLASNQDPLAYLHRKLFEIRLMKKH